MWRSWSPIRAKETSDIPVTLVYCNQRLTAEDCADRTREWAEEQGIPRHCVAFYHALVGEDQKREIEEDIRDGKTRITFCTEALEMVSQAMLSVQRRSGRF